MNMVKTPLKDVSKLQLKPKLAPTLKSAKESIFKNCPPEQPKLQPPAQATLTAKSPAQTLVSRPAAKGIRTITSYFETKERRKMEEIPNSPKM